MSASDSQALVVARSIATIGLGTGVGLMVALPLWTFPALFEIPISSEDRLKYWVQIYNRAKPTAITIFPSAAIIYGIAAYAAEPPVINSHANWIATNRKTILSVCSTLSASVLGYTFTIFHPVIQTLLRQHERVKKGLPSTVSTDDVIKKDWTSGHLLRLSIATTAFILGVSELAFA